jgi:16S rRNA (guanine1207-N2)-methyltransferase
MSSFTIRLAGEGAMWRLAGPGGVELCVENLREAQPAEMAVLPHLPAFSGRVVLPHTGGSPLVPAVIAALNPAAIVELVELDRHDARLLNEKLSTLRNVRVLCAADAEPVDSLRQSGVLLLTERLDRLLAFDYLERLDRILPAGSPLLAMIPKKRATDFAHKLEQHFLKRRTLHSDRHVVVMQGVAGGEPAAWTPRAHEFEASTPSEKVRLVTRPGVFAHGRADAGGLALAESAEVQPGQKILELGCGCGLVGLLLAARLKGAAEFVLVDSNARAVECARRGVELNSFAGIQVELSDVFEPEAATFDCVLGNPPYYAQRRIAEYFVAVAAHALRPGGTLWLVSKHGAEMEALAANYHLQTETRHRRGYDISVCRKPA